MIVRISTEGQYRLSDEAGQRLNDLDNQVVEAVDGGDDGRFRDVFGQMLDLVRSEGEPLPNDEIVESEVILPPPDLSPEEARAEFTGEGLIPG